MDFDRRSYTSEQFERAVKTCTSIAQVLTQLGLKPAGGNYKLAQNTIARLKLDTSHMTGQKWLKDKSHNFKLQPLSSILVKDKIYQSSKLKNRLLKEKVKEYKCECCLNREWLGVVIPLELHHLDGDPYNNLLTNLQLLCPNCHAQTPNYRGKNKRRLV